MKKILLLCMFFLLAMAAHAGPYNIGAYYFPGWKDGAEPTRAAPWKAISNFPDREPYLGWYKEGEPEVTAQHLKWMSEFGINFVVYDWYWTSANKPRLDHAINSYLKLPNRHGVKFSMLWANHTLIPENVGQFDQMVSYWIENYFSDPSYLRENNKPVVIVFSPIKLQSNASKFGSSAKVLLERANKMAVDRGLPGIWFVGAVDAVKSEANELLLQGYSAATAYNYHYGLSGVRQTREPSRSFSELADGYTESWDWLIENSPLPYYLPITSGWDKRPWQAPGVVDAHDASSSTPDQFTVHLAAAKKRLDSASNKTGKTAIICCWNEFGEGSYIEPTKKFGVEYLNKIRTVFGN